MKFELECSVCYRLINSFEDPTYRGTTKMAHKELIICDKCKKNLKKLRGENESFSD